MKNLEYSVDNWLYFLRLSDNELLGYCRTDVFKATGKGGQKKNKTSNAIRLTFYHLVVTKSQSRSKAENTKNALKKLRLAIATDLKHGTSQVMKLSSPPSEIKPYLQSPEIKINPKNPIFPIFIAYLFICFIKNRGSWNKVSQDLGFTPSQLRKFVLNHGELKRMLDKLKEGWSVTSIHAV